MNPIVEFTCKSISAIPEENISTLRSFHRSKWIQNARLTSFEPSSRNSTSIATKEQQLNTPNSLLFEADRKHQEELAKQLVSIRHQLEVALARRPSHQTTLGSPCLNAHDCNRSIARSHCKTDNFTCACLPQHVQLNSNTCLPPALLGFECQLDAQCQQRVPNSHCVSGLCSCPKNLVAHRKDKCLPASDLNDFCLNDKQCQLADELSFCKWKIPQIYGLCKCPPNYKIVTISSNNTAVAETEAEVTSMLGTKTRFKCAPRLGDSCLRDSDCQLATRNSKCARQTENDKPTRWPTSDVSNLKCRCADDFVESPERLTCDRKPAGSVPAEGVSTVDNSRQAASSGDSTTRLAQAASATSEPDISSATSSEQLSLSAAGSMDAKHLYELVIPATPTGGQLNQSAVESSAAGSGLVSSLGKPCKSHLECQASDQNSACLNGICECLLVTKQGCSSSSTGCHKDTFQCRNGQCISWYFVCDNFANCADGSDEDECKWASCPPEAFQCDNGACLARGKLCDGRPDCADASDERHCTGGGSGAGSGCPPKTLACNDGQCKPAYAFCNAVADCADGSDEDEQVCERTGATTQVLSARRPAHQQQEAARRPAPPDAPADSPLVKTDRRAIELMLAALAPQRTPQSRGRRAPIGRQARLLGKAACPSWAFACKNGKCRSSAILCSGVDGCGDNSDENQCQVCKCPAPGA